MSAVFPPDRPFPATASRSALSLQAIVLMAFLLRLLAASGPLSAEEAQIAALSGGAWPDIPALLATGVAPLYPLVLSPFAGSAENDALWLRLPSLVFGTLLPFWLFRLGALWQKPVGLVAAFLAALAPPLVGTSVQAGPQALALLLAAVALYYALAWLNGTRLPQDARKPLWIYAATAIALVCTAPSSAVFLLTLGAALAFWGPGETRLRDWLLVQGLVLCAALPFLMPRHSLFWAGNATPLGAGSLLWLSPLPALLAWAIALAVLVPFARIALREGNPAERIRHGVVALAWLCGLGAFVAGDGIPWGSLPALIIMAWSVLALWNRLLPALSFRQPVLLLGLAAVLVAFLAYNQQLIEDWGAKP